MRLIFGAMIVSLLSGCQAPEKGGCPACRPSLAATPTDLAPAPPTAIFDSPTAWQDDAGRDFHFAELRGHPVVLSMFYASCEGVCVITKNDLQAIEASLPAAVRERTLFVLVTLAPDRDGPAALKKYRLDQGLSEKRWRLLRGPAADTAHLATALAVGYGRDGAGLFRHSSEITVLDPAGKILLQQDGLHADLAAMVRALSDAVDGN